MKYKFRGRRFNRLLEKFEWVTGSLIEYPNRFVIFDDEKHGAFKVIGSSVGMFSGLKDSGGVEIYEGDNLYLAGYGPYKVKFPFAELYEAASEGDIGWLIQTGDDA